MTRASKRNHKRTKTGMTCRVSTKYHIEHRHVPKGKDVQWIQGFPSLRCLAPPESSMGYWEKIGNRKSDQRKETELMQTIKYEHVFPLLKTCNFSRLKHQASWVFDVILLSHWRTLPLSILSPPIEMIKLWCDLSLLPLTSISKKGSSGCLLQMGSVLEWKSKAASRMWCW